MEKLRALQNDLINFLVYKKDSAEAHIANSPPIDTQTRLNIYSNAYRLTFRGVIDKDHELLSFYLGDDLFDLLVAGYIEKHPSQHTSLRDFCRNVPDYLKHNAPFSEHPVLAELARFEQSLLFSFDADDAPVTRLEQLSSLNTADWPSLKIRFHASAQLFETQWNCVSIWQALKQGQTPPGAASMEFAAWLIWRNQEKVTEFRSIEESELKCMRAFLQGHTLSEVCELLLEDYRENEVSQVVVTFLAQWLNASLITALITD